MEGETELSMGYLTPINNSDNDYFFNSSMWLDSEYNNPFDLLSIRIIFIILYGFVFACCFVGNLLVIIVILIHKKMRSVTNFFLGNLALADLCVGIFCVLPNLSLNLSSLEWIFGRALCKITYFVQSMAYTASITILTVISIERYMAIIHPIKSKQWMTLCLLRIIIIIVWTIAACCGIPNLIFYDTITIPSGLPSGHNISFCLLKDDEFNLKAYNITNFVLWYISPLMLMSVMYARISMVLWKTSQVDAKRHKENKRIKVSFKKSKNEICVDQHLQAPVESHTNNHISTSYVNKQDSHTLTKHGPLQHDEESCIDDENSTLVKSNDKAKNNEDLDNDDSFAEDFEDDWPGNSSKNGVKMTYIGNSTMNSSTNINGLRINYPTHSSKNASTANRMGPAIRFTVMNKKACRKVEGALLARRRVIRLLLAVIISFAVCMLPYHVRVIWQSFARSPEISFFQKLIPPGTFVIYYLNSGLNPLLYAFLSANFRRSLWQVLTCQNTGRAMGRQSTMIRSYSASRTANTNI